MNEERTNPTQEVEQAAPPEPQPQAGQGQGAGEERPKQDSVQDPTQEVERLRRELEKVRQEAAKRRLSERTLEERLAELEREWQRAKERAALAEAKTVLLARLQDPVAAEAALKLARADGLLRESEDGVDVDLDALLQRYPILRRTSAPQDSGANPVQSGHRLTADDIARMSPEEYARRRKEILAMLARGEIR